MFRKKGRHANVEELSNEHFTLRKVSTLYAATMGFINTGVSAYHPSSLCERAVFVRDECFVMAHLRRRPICSHAVGWFAAALKVGGTIKIVMNKRHFNRMVRAVVTRKVFVSGQGTSL